MTPASPPTPVPPALAEAEAEATEAAEAEARAAILDCAILIVDDTPFNRTLIGAILEEAGFRNLAYAESGQEALAMIAGRMPDLLILDIMMPGMDGFEVCRRLRADPEGAALPILVQTALSSGDDRNRAFAAGTTDLVSKPLDRTELLARVRIHLESRVLIRRLSAFRARVEAELTIARSMQEHLLPSPAVCAALGEAAGVVLRAHTAMAPDLGGDLWGVVRLDGRRFGVFLLNMDGQGVSAAMNAFRLHTLMHELAPDHGTDPATLLAILNDRAVELLGDDQHATVIYGVVDTRPEAGAGRFVYAAADAAPPMVLRAGDAEPLFGRTEGLPVGVAPGTRYETRDLPLPPGAVLTLCSVAVFQALDTEGGLGAAIGQALAEGGGATTSGSTTGFEAVVGRLGATLSDSSGDDHTLLWIERSAA